MRKVQFYARISNATCFTDFKSGNCRRGCVRPDSNLLPENSGYVATCGDALQGYIPNRTLKYGLRTIAALPCLDNALKANGHQPAHFCARPIQFWTRQENNYSCLLTSEILALEARWFSLEP